MIYCSHKSVVFKIKKWNPGNPILCVSAFLLLYLLGFPSIVQADQTYSVDQMSGIYSGAWVQTAYDFTYYEPISGFEDRKASRDAIMSDAVYYRYNKAMDLFVLIYRGFQDYEPTLDGIRNYVTGLGCTEIQNVSCNGMSAIQFMNQTDHYRELNIAFPDSEGAIIQVTVQCPDDNILRAFGHEVFSSVFPNAAADTYLQTVGEESVGHIYHLADFGGIYTGSWVTLKDFFRFCAPSDAGWVDLTGTESALSCDAIAMYQNDSLGIVIIIYYGFQPYDTTDGIFSALSTRPEYLNLHYSRCNGLKVVDFEKENRDHSIAFADSAGGIVQVTVQCADPTLRYLYSDQLFSSLTPVSIQAVNGEDVPQEYIDFLQQPVIDDGSETLSLEGSQYALHDVNGDGIPELLVRFRKEGTSDGLSDIYIFVLIDGQVRHAGTLAYVGTTQSAGLSSKGYFYEETHDYGHSYFRWNVFQLSGASLELAVTLRIEINLNNVSLSAYYINDKSVSPDEFMNTFIIYLDGDLVAGSDGMVNWDGFRPISFIENVYIVVILNAPAVSDDKTAYTRTDLTEGEKELYADFLSDDIWQQFYSPDIPDQFDTDLFPQFCMVDVTGDGHEELAVQSQSESGQWCVYFYRAVDEDVVLIGGLSIFDGYTSLGYSNVSHLPYVFWIDYGNPLMYVKVLNYDGTEVVDYDDVMNYGNTVFSFNLRDDQCFINDEEVSFEEFCRQFRDVLGEPVPYSDNTYGINRYLWDGYTPFDLIDNTPENRLRVLGYEGTPRLWD